MTVELKVPDMACGACAENITKAVQTLDSQAIIKADLETKQVTIETEASASSVKEAITSAGYNPT